MAKVILWFIAISLLIASLTVIIINTIPISPSSLEPIGMIQYAGGFSRDYDPWAYEPGRLPLASNSIATIGEYEVSTSTTDFSCYYSNWKCSGNNCGGTPTGQVDDMDCPLYHRPASGGDKCCEITTDSSTRCPTDIQAWCSGYTNCDIYGVHDGGNCYQRHTPETTCGYKTRDQLGCDSGCWAKYTIKKNGETVKETTDYSKSQQFVEVDDFFSANMLMGSHFYYASCKRVDNTFVYSIPNGYFSSSIHGNQSQITVTLNNNFRPLTGKISIQYMLEYFVYNQAFNTTYTYEEYLTLPLSKTTFTFYISDKPVANNLYIKPRLDILLSGKEFSGVNGICYGQVSNEVTDLNLCNYVKFGDFEGETQTISISQSKNSCLQVGCQEGYSCNEENGYCQKESISPIAWYFIFCLVVIILLLAFMLIKKKK